MDKSVSPLISVLLPIYNAENYIEESVLSIINQSYLNWELLIYNDASNDNTLTILNNFKDERITIFNSTINRGIVYALNQLIPIAKGEYIARMDADDICYQNRFQVQVEYLKKNSAVALVGSWANTIDKNGKDLKIEYRHCENVTSSLLFYHNNIIHSSVMGRSELFRDNLYSNNFTHAEDYFLWSTISYDKILKNIQIPLVKYRIHDSSISRKFAFDQDKSIKDIFEYHLKMLNIHVSKPIYLELHFAILSGRIFIESNELSILQSFFWISFIKYHLVENELYDEIHQYYLSSFEPKLMNQFSKLSFLKYLIFVNLKSEFNFSFFKSLHFRIWTSLTLLKTH